MHPLVNGRERWPNYNFHRVIVTGLMTNGPVFTRQELAAVAIEDEDLDHLIGRLRHVVVVELFPDMCHFSPLQ